MDSSEFERRRSLTFAQAEGAEPLPRQLKKEEISQELRSRILAIINAPFEREILTIHQDRGIWSVILKSAYLNYYFGMADSYRYELVIKRIKDEVKTGDYIKFYGVIQFLLRESLVPEDFKNSIAGWLEACRSAYRVVDSVLMPIASEEEHNAITKGIESAASSNLHGARHHLVRAAHLIGDGKWADSVRESIHAVESAARQISGADSLASALNQLSKGGHIHAAMNEGFKKLYGYASDQGGIRHALLDDGDAKVTERDALFMLGACASFVSYLTASALDAGLLPNN